VLRRVSLWLNFFLYNCSIRHGIDKVVHVHEYTPETGKEGMDAGGIPPLFAGIAVHD
jgi:hypothetical protein